MGEGHFGCCFARSVCLSVSLSLSLSVPPLSLCMLRGGTHGLMVGKTHGQTVGETYGQMVGEMHLPIVGGTYGQMVGETQGQMTGETHGQTVGRTHGQIVGETHLPIVGETHGRMIGETHGRRNARSDCIKTCAGERRTAWRMDAGGWTPTRSKRWRLVPPPNESSCRHLTVSPGFQAINRTEGKTRAKAIKGELNQSNMLLGLISHLSNFLIVCSSSSLLSSSANARILRIPTPTSSPNV